MRWFLITLAALTALMLWRDLKSGRVYAMFDRRHYYDPDAEEYDTKAESPIWFRVWTSLAAIAALTGFMLGVLPAFVTETDSGIMVLSFCFMIQLIYLGLGSIGRACDWIKHYLKDYGSVDKK